MIIKRGVERLLIVFLTLTLTLGQLSDCWLMCALSALAEYGEERIRPLFHFMDEEAFMQQRQDVLKMFTKCSQNVHKMLKIGEVLSDR